MAEVSPEAAAGDSLDRRTIMALLAMSAAVLVVANDFTALSVALPKIERDLRVDVTTGQWVINGYALVFGVLIVSGGRLADTVGRRRVFFIGAAIFAGFSVLGGVSRDIELLLASRAAMGVGGALMWPAILGMTYAILPKSRAGLAGGLILGSAGLGNALGPLIGGCLTDVLTWRWIFFLNMPVAAFAVYATWRYVHIDEDLRSGERFDYLGVAAISLGLLSLLVALDQGADDGWTDPLIMAMFAAGAVLLGLFGLIERRTGDAALIPPDVLTNRGFMAACGSVLLTSAIFFAALLYLPQLMALGFGYSALESGAGLLPMMGTFAVTSFVAGPLYGKLGPKPVVCAGAGFLGVGVFILSFVQPDWSYVWLVPGMLVLGIGVGLFYSSITTASVTAVDPSRASLAGGLIYMCQIAGGSLGLGLNTAIVVSTSLTTGLGRAFLLDAVLAAVGLLVALLWVGGRIDPQRLRGLGLHHHQAHLHGQQAET
jgi:EmrB/QacA subfamily drug resistance transporter